MEEFKKLLPGFGKHLAIAGKEVETHRKKMDEEAGWSVKWFSYKLVLT